MQEAQYTLLIAAEYAGCMPSTKPSKRSGKSNWTWWEATLNTGGRASVNCTYMPHAYTTLQGVSKGLIKGGAYNWTKKGVSKSYNQWQNELRHLALKGLFELLFFFTWSSPGLCFKTRVGAQPLIWKSFFILMQIELIFTRKVVHLASFWKWGFLELGSGLL